MKLLCEILHTQLCLCTQYCAQLMQSSVATPSNSMKLLCAILHTQFRLCTQLYAKLLQSSAATIWNSMNLLCAILQMQFRLLHAIMRAIIAIKGGHPLPEIRWCCCAQYCTRKLDFVRNFARNCCNYVRPPSEIRWNCCAQYCTLNLDLHAILYTIVSIKCYHLKFDEFVVRNVAHAI